MTRVHRRPYQWFLAAFVLMGAAATPAAAQEPVTRCDAKQGQAPDVFDLGLEELLNARVITASRFSEKEAEAPGVISVVSRDEIHRFGGTTLHDVLERVPGLTGTTAYFTDRSMVAARGDQTKIDGGHVLVLINGRPTREILEGGVISDVLESFPIAVLEQIEVIRGPGSVLYGSNAFSAVINLITTDVDTTGFTISGAGGAGGAMAMSATGRVKCGDLKVLASAQINDKREWAAPYRIREEIVGDFAPPVPQLQNVSIRDHAPGGFVDVRYKGFTFMTALAGFKTSSFVRGSVSRNNWGRTFADAGYAFTVTPAWHSGVNLTVTRTKLDVPGFPYIARRAHESILEWTNSLKVSDATQVSFGALYNRIAGSEVYAGVTPSITISEGSRPGSALYGQVNHLLGRRVNLIGGFQANKIGALDLDVVPRGGVVLHVTPGIHIKALYAKAFRAPSINETNLNHPGLVGRLDNRPEKVGTFDLQLSYHGKRAQGSVGYFRSRQTDSIIVDSSTPRWEYRNLGEATFQGVEAEGKYYVHPNVLVLGSVLHQSNEDGQGNVHVTPVSNVGAKAGVSYQSHGVTASIFDSYQGNIDGFAGTVTPTVNPGTSAYHQVTTRLRMDLSALVGVDRRGRGLAIFLQGENLTNKEVWHADWGGNSGDTLPAYGGRSVYFGVEVF